MSHHKKSDAVAHDRVDPAVKQNLVMPIVRVLADMKKQFGSLIFLFASVFVLAACSGGTSTSTTVSGTTSYTNNNLLANGASLDVSAANQIIIDVRSAALYAAGHITNAINIPHSALNATSNALDITTAVNALSAAGVSNTAKIIVYGADIDGNTGWVFWALEYLGAKNAQVLNGGYAKWVADGRTVSTTATTLPATTFTPAVDTARLATKADVVAHYADTTHYAIIDSRNYSDATANNFVTSHIPNAVSILVGDFLNADKTVRSYADLKTLLDAKGITTGKTVITHCYVGLRSAQEYFVLRLMGFNASNYDGSWTEWAADTTLPVHNVGLLASGATLDVNAANQVIIDIRSAADYAVGHITNAINIPHSTLNAASNALDTTTAVNTLSAAGVSNTAKIVVYGADIDGNTGWAFWVLEYLGAQNVQVLDGGYNKWVADARTVSTTATTLPAKTFTPAVNAAALATKADVVAHYADTSNYAIVDSRNYRDATTNNYVTSHIPNAVSILIGDFLNADKTVKPYTDLKTLLDAKGVTTGKTVITHCYVGWRSAQEYLVLRVMGFKVSNYDGSWAEWAADTTSLPTQAGAQAGLLANASSLDVNAANQVIIDARSAADYAAGHITNAINLPPSALDTASNSYELNTPAAAATVLGAAGVSDAANIIVYGKKGDFGAKERVFWALEYLGAKKVAILDGGYDKWVADGRAVSTTATTLPAAVFTPAVDATRLATKADVVAHYADTAHYAIVDSRSNADYATAHIPNAINIIMTDYLNTDGTTKSYAEIKTMLEAKGVTAGKTVIAHCYVGYMSGQGYFMARLMGINTSNYDGSWTEWAADTTLPTRTGSNP